MYNSLKGKPEGNHFGLKEAPVFYPSEEEFADPLKYIKSIKNIGEKAGICKIIPPQGWNPPFSIDEKVYKYFMLIPKRNVRNIICYITKYIIHHYQCL